MASVILNVLSGFKISEVAIAPPTANPTPAPITVPAVDATFSAAPPVLKTAFDALLTRAVVAIPAVAPAAVKVTPLITGLAICYFVRLAESGPRLISFKSV